MAFSKSPFTKLLSERLTVIDSPVSKFVRIIEPGLLSEPLIFTKARSNSFPANTSSAAVKTLLTSNESATT